MQHSDRKHFKKFVAAFGGGFKHRQHKITLDDRGRITLAGMPVSSPESLPGNFIRLDVGEADYLFMLAGLAKHGIVELGRMDGGSVFLLAYASEDIVPIWSIDCEPTDDARVRKLLKEHELDRDDIQLLVGYTGSPWPEILSYDLLFIDADHSYEGCLTDLKNWWGNLTPGGHVLLHDCMLNAVMTAVIDFTARRTDVEFIRGPYLPSGSCLHDWAGTMAHLRKRAI